jgi:hypothetical protein
LREAECFTFIRCGKYKDRPGHADNLHVDVWVNGENILRDSGTYKYNTEKTLQDYFNGTASHNTVVVDDKSQMLKGSRFIWYYWSHAKQAEWTEAEDAYIYRGELSAFRYINPKATHVRIVTKKKGNLEWIVEDKVDGLANLEKKQIWHHDESNVDLKAVNKQGDSIKAKSCASYNSTYYGKKQKGMATSFSFERFIKTTIQLKKQTTK